MAFRSILMGITFALMWSSAFATARIIVAHAAPLMALSARFFISGVIAVLVARALGQTWRMQRGQVRSIVIFGLCQNAAYLGLNFMAMQTTPAALAAIIASTMPLMVAVLGWAFRGQRIAPLGLIGLISGFAGVVLIMSHRLSAGGDVAGVAMCCLGAFALAVATIFLKSATAGGNLLMVVGLQMLVGAVSLLFVAVLFETPYLTVNPAFLWAFGYQILVPGLAATVLWFALVARVGSLKASSFHFLNPAFGVTIAALLLGEAVTALDVVGVAVTAAGIWALQVSQAQAA